MLGEIIRHTFGWEVWSTIDRDDPVQVERGWEPWHALQDGWLVGTWTGPRRDQLCVARCSSVEQAQAWLAPAAPTVLLATLASLLVRARFERPSPALVELAPIVRRRYARELAMVSERIAVDQVAALASASAGSGASISPSTRRSRPSTSNARSPASYRPSW